MKKHAFHLFIVLSFFPACLRATPAAMSFAQRLNKMGMVFTMPPGFREVPVKPSGDVLYHYAIRHLTAKIELRYILDTVEERPAVQSASAASANLMTILMNLSGGAIAPIKAYAPADVKAEYHADFGFTTGPTKMNSEFGKGFVLGQVSLVHKDGAGNSTQVVLFDDIGTVIKDYTASFHALRFK